MVVQPCPTTYICEPGFSSLLFIKSTYSIRHDADDVHCDIDQTILDLVKQQKISLRSDVDLVEHIVEIKFNSCSSHFVQAQLRIKKLCINKYILNKNTCKLFQ
ncbi:hypothetical protein RF11_09948 [Thelohanellus kitauei]|uniref:Uncharacterized protein n=1 Tax=Thelohanellus kitauei TaxID=669202 RepID=A0A0C2M8Q7_THEKT|nr:hypothetical protein RF11_09948 [Thelohanellus kitauei]